MAEKQTTDVDSLSPPSTTTSDVSGTLAQVLEKVKPSPWSRQLLQLHFFIAIAFLNSCIHGYVGSVMTGINVMEYYQGYFHLKGTGSSTGLIFSIYAIGSIVGSFVCGPLSDRWGRRWGMFISAMVIIISTLVQASSINMAMFILGRFILGIGSSVSASAGASYVAEIAHPAWRGTITGLYNTFWFVGYIAAAFVIYGMNNIKSDLQWRLPIWLQILLSSGFALGCLFCPESPRWLVSNNYNEEAIQVMTKYYGDGDRDSPFVQLSYKQMVEQITTEGSDKCWWDFRELFNSRNSWWRMACVSGMAFCSQWTGNGAISYYLPVLLQQVGVKSVETQLLYNAILSILCFVAAIFGARLSDSVGRRPMLLVASALFVVQWTIITALTSVYGNDTNTNSAGSGAAIAFICLFAITYSVCFTPLTILYAVECLPFETRAKGMGIFTLSANIAGFFNMFAIPIILDRVTWKAYFLYIAWDAIQFLFIYFVFVETKGHSLEEINEIFEAPYPKKKSLEKPPPIEERA